MARYHFERESRTPFSEAYVVHIDDSAVGRVDLHYASDVVFATICVPENFSEEEIQDLIGEVDERLVASAEPFRDDFVATVWLGRQAGVYSEDLDAEVEDEIEVVEGDGHRES